MWTIYILPYKIKAHDHLRWHRADVLRENTEAVFAACDAAHGRWAKLLGVRAALHPRLRLQEFLIIYNITEEFIAATEKVISFPVWNTHTTVRVECIEASVDVILASYSCRLEAGWVTTFVEFYSNSRSSLLIISIAFGSVLQRTWSLKSKPYSSNFIYFLETY